MEPVLVPIWPDAGRAIGLGRTKTFELVGSGELPSVRVGRRRLVPVSAIRDYAERLMAEQGQPAA